MKNKNIIPLTIAMVAVVLIGMLGLSRVFEAGWTNEKEINNTLDTNRDVYEISDLGAFPYMTMEEYLSLDVQDNNYYRNPPDIIPITDDMISIDEAAVIGGSVLEKIYPLENFRDLTFVVFPENRIIKDKSGELIVLGPAYTGFYSEKFENKSREKKSFYYTLDAVTKEIISLRYSIAENYDKGEQILLVDDPVIYAKEIAYELGYKNLKAYFVETGEYGAGGTAYRVDFLIDDNQSITIGFNSFNDTFLFMKNIAEFSDYHTNLLENGVGLE